MREIRQPLARQTLAVWQPRTLRVLTIEDTRQIVENVAGFFEILLEWNAAEQHEARGKADIKSDTAGHSTRDCLK